jgi:hypothetical protein
VRDLSYLSVVMNSQVFWDVIRHVELQIIIDFSEDCITFETPGIFYHSTGSKVSEDLNSALCTR